MSQDTAPLPADVDSERAVLLIALEPANKSDRFNGTGASHFTGPLRPLLWRLASKMREAGAPVSVSNLERAYLASPDDSRVPPAAAEAEFHLLRETFAYPGNLDYFMTQIEMAAAKRKVARTAEAIQRAVSGGEEPETILKLISQLPEDARGLEPNPTPTALMPLTGLDLSAELPPVPEPLAGNDKAQLIMPGEAVLIASDPGVGKTKLLTAIALGVAAGKEILDLACGQRPAVYVTSDGDPDLLRNLHRQWDGMRTEGTKLADLPLFVESDDDFNLEAESCFSRLRLTLDQRGLKEKPGLLIIESLASNIATTDLNDQVSVRQYVRKRIRSLMAEFPGLTVIVSAHLRKTQEGGKSDLGNRVAGSMQLRGGFDCVIGLVNNGKDAFSVRRIKRSRSGGDFEPFRIQIYGERQEPLSLTNAGTVEVSLEEARGAARFVMDFMLKGGGKRLLKDMVTAITAIPDAPRKRAIEAAAKKLAEGNDPFLVRLRQKPAAYDLAHKPEQSDLRGLD